MSMARSKYPAYILLSVGFLSCSNKSVLPPDPQQWVCSKPQVSDTQVKQWCDSTLPSLDFNWRAKVELPMEAGQITNLEKKNAYDFALRKFLRQQDYSKKLNWTHDKNWRLTGPYVGEFGDGDSYGVHPAVRIYYSPEVVEWICKGQPDTIRAGAMIIKEMHSIDKSLGITREKGCMHIPTQDSSPIEAQSWTVMARSDQSYDGWYWANPTAQGDGNPPILDKSAFTTNKDVPKDGVERNENWYPTGYFFQDNKKINDIIYPYSLFGSACINCHSTALTLNSFSSIDNILTEGIVYKWFAATQALVPGSDDRHAVTQSAPIQNSLTSSIQKPPFTQPLDKPSQDFIHYYSSLDPIDFNSVWALRLPAETYDHHIAGKNGADKFLTSDQCISCHDATYSNSAEPNMLIAKFNSNQKINVSPYGEWRVSPMGLAGRDPIFYSQLQSETNNLPQITQCIENTCLHCHGVMGQRQLAIDTRATAKDQCKDIFALAPPKQVPFGKPFAKSMVSQWQTTPENNDAKYGALARDGISCTVCHHISADALDSENSYTGNFVTGPADELYGPYKDDSIIPKPMKHALNIAPKHAKQITDSNICGSCHNILLPIFNNDGTPAKIEAPTGKTISASYEQSTNLEWLNSDFAKSQSFQSCQDCHMPTHFKVGNTHNPLKDIKIANIESDEFAPTSHQLPDKEIRLTARDRFARHSLHGLNVFLNEMFQQFPMVLGIRQMDYMLNSNVQPALITSRDSMLEMAQHETADVTITDIKPEGEQLKVTVKVINKVGHYLPSGVGFRRVFVELVVLDKSGHALWASGRTNDLGVIVKGISEEPLDTEKGGMGVSQFQPHYQTITQEDQVQIYQELIKDSADELTTSFLRRVKTVKDNRLRPKGFDPAFFASNSSPYIQLLAELPGDEKNDPYYTDPKLTGSDSIIYKITLPKNQLEKAQQVSVRLYNQSIPPAYLQDRFSDANQGPQKKEEIQRLYYITSHLNTQEESGADAHSIHQWKLEIASACQRVDGKLC